MAAKKKTKITKESRSALEFKKTQEFVENQLKQNALQKEAQKRRLKKLQDKSIPLVVKATSKTSDKNGGALPQPSLTAKDAEANRITKEEAEQRRMITEQADIERQIREFQTRSAILVTNLPPSFSKILPLNRFFSQFGAIKHISVSHDQFGDRASATVLFRNNFSAKAAKRGASGEIVENVTIKVKVIDPGNAAWMDSRETGDHLGRTRKYAPHQRDLGKIQSAEGWKSWTKKFSESVSSYRNARLEEIAKALPDVNYTYPPCVRLRILPDHLERLQKRLKGQNDRDEKYAEAYDKALEESEFVDEHFSKESLRALLDTSKITGKDLWRKRW